MNEYESLNHTKWECKYHVVFIPKYRRKALYGSLRKHLGSLFRELARHKECEIGEGHLMVDHVHMLISIPPKYSVSQVMGTGKRYHVESRLFNCMMLLNGSSLALETHTFLLIMKIPSLIYRILITVG